MSYLEASAQAHQKTRPSDVVIRAILVGGLAVAVFVAMMALTTQREPKDCKPAATRPGAAPATSAPQKHCG